MIVIASDHNGVAQKAALVAGLPGCIDLGPWGEARVDYVDYARQVAAIVASGQAERGILVCGTGVGMSIVANKEPRVRAVLAHSIDVGRKSREHNDTNVLCLGAWVHDARVNLEIARSWLAEGFGEGRHEPRVARIEPPPRRVVFTNGCFDLLHAGHLRLLRFAASLGDELVVGLNSDASVRRLKGEGRPLNRAEDRRAVLEALRWVDEVIPFEANGPQELIQQVRPAVVVKGGEWTAEDVRQRDGIPPWCEVHVCPLLPGYSTTATVERARE